MAGKLVRLFPKTPYDFSSVAGGSTQEIIIKPFVECTDYTQGELLVRIHSMASAPPSGGEIAVYVITAAQTDDDPGMNFGYGDYSSPVAKCTIDDSTSTPSGDDGVLLKANLSSNFGSQLVCVVYGKQPATPGTVKATLSADLVLKA